MRAWGVLVPEPRCVFSTRPCNSGQAESVSEIDFAETTINTLRANCPGLALMESDEDISSERAYSEALEFTAETLFS
jgi:hypothetical protein